MRTFARGGAPHVDVRVVGVEHRGAALRKRANDRRVLGCDIGNALHEFLVLALRVVDDRDGRLRDGSEFGRLAGMVHPEFDRGDVVFRKQAQQRQRKADRVVQVAFRRQRARPAVVRAQDRRQHFLDGGLAVASDDDDDGKHEPGPPMRGQRTQRSERVRHRNEVAGERSDPILGHERGGRSVLERCLHEIVSVEAFAFDRDEEVARNERARVGRHARKAHVPTQHPAVHGARGGRRVHHATSMRVCE